MPRRPSSHARKGKPKRDSRAGKSQVFLDAEMLQDVALLRRLKMGETIKDLVRASLRFTTEVAGACEKGARLQLAKPGESPQTVRVLIGRAVL